MRNYVQGFSLSHAPCGFGALYRGFLAFLTPSNCLKTTKLRSLCTVHYTSVIFNTSLIVDDVNESMNAFAETLWQITDKHAPVRKLSNKMRAQLSKPWITSAILKSIKKRQKLFTTHFLSNDPNKVKEYKKYNNKLNKIKEATTTNYFKTHFDMFSDNFLSRNTGVISKLRHYLSLKQLTEIY